MNTKNRTVFVITALDAHTEETVIDESLIISKFALVREQILEETKGHVIITDYQNYGWSLPPFLNNQSHDLFRFEINTLDGNFEEEYSEKKVNDYLDWVISETDPEKKIFVIGTGPLGDQISDRVNGTVNFVLAKLDAKVDESNFDTDTTFFKSKLIKEKCFIEKGYYVYRVDQKFKRKSETKNSSDSEKDNDDNSQVARISNIRGWLTLRNGTVVNPDHIVSIRHNETANEIKISLSNGDLIHFPIKEGETFENLADRIAELAGSPEINVSI